MASTVPNTMQALAFHKWCTPSEYDLATLPVPKIKEPDDILIKVHSASVNPGEVKIANGMLKMAMKPKFPLQIGYDVAGVVAAIGSAVTNFQVGDEVVCRVAQKHHGTIAEYALTSEYALAKKPNSISFSDAASIPLVGLTGLQALEAADKAIPGGIKGKTVFVPGGLSGTGGIGIQLAKHYFGAAKVITTVSTSKVSKVEELLGAGTVDQVIDYTKEDWVKSIGAGTVDVLFDTMGYTLTALPVMKRGGMITSVSTPMSGYTLKDFSPDMPWWLFWLLNLADWFYTWRVQRIGVKYVSLLSPESGSQVETMMNLVENGKVRPLVGKRASLYDIEAVREGCEQILSGKGMLGKFVIDVI